MSRRRWWAVVDATFDEHSGGFNEVLRYKGSSVTAWFPLTEDGEVDDTSDDIDNEMWKHKQGKRVEAKISKSDLLANAKGSIRDNSDYYPDLKTVKVTSTKLIPEEDLWTVEVIATFKAKEFEQDEKFKNGRADISFSTTT